MIVVIRTRSAVAFYCTGNSEIGSSSADMDDESS